MTGCCHLRYLYLQCLAIYLSIMQISTFVTKHKVDWIGIGDDVVFIILVNFHKSIWLSAVKLAGEDGNF